MKIKAIKIISFILIFCILLYSVSRVLRFKNEEGIYQVDSFYEQIINSVDVLFIGSSHVFININPAILYDEYGIAAYHFASAGQPIWITYYYLLEALKTNIPKLIVLESYIIADSRTHTPDSQIISATYALKWSKNRIESLKIATADRFNEFINPMYRYHNRYKNLQVEDFISYANNYNHYKYFKGYFFQNRIYPMQKSDIENIKDTLPLLKQQETYYRKTLELAKTNKIPIVVIASPFPMKSDITMRFNRVGEIAKEYEIPFINFYLYHNEYYLDFSSDFSDTHHLNYKGAIKFTKYLGKYLKENYDLPDRRGDPKYYSWEMNAKYEYKGIYNIELKQSKNLNEYIEKVKNADDYVIGITMLGNYKKDDAIIKNIAAKFNINDIYLKNASYVVDNNKLIYSSSGSNQYLFYDEIGSYTDLVADSGQKLSINRTNYIKTKNGINMVIYDKFTEEIVDNIYLEYKGNSINPTIKR